MAVYVDTMNAPYRRMIMCHMGADTTKELLRMADKIGVHRKWLQHAGEKFEHFDICLSKKALAIEAGAIEVSPRKFVMLAIARDHARKKKAAPDRRRKAA